MSYQVLARKWRPQRFEDVVGQRAVTQTLRNAIVSGRIAQSFVFAGPRGVGKTTTARILARGLNCAEGPTADPCGRCEACLEIAEGRDMDVLEIDAASHTGIDNVREVIIAGLGIPPVRDRYKVFVIDEVHQLSPQSFNALLKSIEEPPPHVAFIMATTELRKVPETIQSRSQVFEFKLIPTRAIAAQLQKIVEAETLTVADDALALIVRAADGSMRDAETAFDQVIAFAGETITLDDAATVLGVVGRDLLFEMVTAVADENPAAAFDLTARAIEVGSDLKRVCRELSKVVRDLMVVSIDPERLADPEIAAEGERERVRALAARFSREDLLRAFDVLTRAEADLSDTRNVGDPRYRFEMALLKWIHLRKLVPLAQLIEQLQAGGKPPGGPAVPVPRTSTPVATPARPSASGLSPSVPPARPGEDFDVSPAPAPSVTTTREPAPVTSKAQSGSAGSAPAGPAVEVDSGRSEADPSAASGPSRLRQVVARQAQERRATKTAEGSSTVAPHGEPRHPPGGLTRESLLAEIGELKPVFFRTVVAQAQRIEVDADRVVFTFAPAQETLKANVDQQRAWLESVSGRLAGRKMPVSAVMGAATGGRSSERGNGADRRSDLRAKALAHPIVQAMLDVFPADIREVEELK